MHWILQENLFKETEWENLIATLRGFDIPFSTHKVIPFIGELVPAPEPKHEHVICFGSYSMRHSAKKFNWTPGVFDLFNVNFNVQLQHWGDLMLNADSVVIPFKGAWLAKPTFVRPIDDSKYFAGAVFDPAEFNEWVHKVVDLEEDYGNSLTGDTLIQMCKPKQIYAEYRFWVVDKKIITCSLYKRGNRVIYSADVDDHVRKFADSVVCNAWQPAPAYVLDVCETPDGMKIVEINTINSAGFYAADVVALVSAFENMKL